MKKNGESVFVPFKKWVLFPRGDNEDIAFLVETKTKLQEQFEKLVPKPEPPVRRTLNSEETEVLFNDKKYQKAILEYATLMQSYNVLMCVKLPEDWEWDTVDINDPKTFTNWQDEMISAGFSDTDVSRLSTEVGIALGLNNYTIEEATKSFLAGLRQKERNLSTQNTEPSNISSSEPAKE